MKRVGILISVLLAVSLLVAVACGGGGEPSTATPTSAPTDGSIPTPTAPPTTPPQSPPPVGDLVALGKFIYLNLPDNVGDQPLWCSQCHTIEGVSVGLIGPDHSHVATWAADRKPGFTAEEYIRESILTPEVFVAGTDQVERSVAGLMTSDITAGLTEDQVDALVAWLLTRK